MKKLLFLISFLTILGGANSVFATKLNADLSKLSNGPSSTWDGTTSTMTWTQTSNNMISNFDFATGDYKIYTKIVVNVSDLDNATGVRLQIKANGKERLVVLNGAATHEKSLTTDFGFSVADLEALEWVRLLGSNGGTTIDGEHPASAKINEVYFYSPDRTKDVNLSKMAASSGTATWAWDSEKSEGLFSWTGTWSNSIALPGLTGNLSGYTTVNYNTVAGTADHFRILIYYSNGAAQTTYAATVGTKSVSFAEMGVDPVNLAFISSINFSGASDVTGNVTLKSFSLSGPEKNYINAVTTYAAPAGTTDINGMTGAGVIKWTVTYPQVIANETGWCGNIDDDDKSVDISSYDYLHFVVTDASLDASCGLRVFVATQAYNPETESGDKNKYRKILYPRPIANAGSVADKDWEEKYFITSPGTYVVKISDYPLLRGFKALQSWNGNAGTITVSQAYVSSGNPVAYIPSGKYTLYGELSGSSALTKALADASTTYYDATGVTGSGVDLTSVANLNALFKANSGVLANTNNVIVGSTCANLVLTDGYPFKAPSDFTATAASYSRNLGSAGAGTLCLPFEAAIPDGVTAYTLNYTLGKDKAKATGVVSSIPANTPVLLNGTGSATFSGSTVEIDADATNVSGALTGVFKATAVPRDSYVLQDGDNGIGFYLVNSDDIIANPFRAYLTADGAGARSITIEYDDVTGVSDVKAKNDISKGIYYNLSGQRVSKPTKGLFIVDGKVVRF